MRRLVVLLPLGLLLVGGGIAIGRYVVPTRSAVAPFTPTTATAQPSTTTTTSPAPTTTGPPPPQGSPTPGVYDIVRSNPGGPNVGLFLVVQHVPPGPSLPAGGISIEVSNRTGDGSTQLVDRLVGTAADGIIALNSQTHPGEGTYQGSKDGEVSGKYGAKYIFFGGGMCGAWGGPTAVQACSFALTPS